MKRWDGKPSRLGELWELPEKGVAQNLMSTVLFCYLHISFVNDPLKIYLSLHIDNIKCHGSVILFLLLFILCKYLESRESSCSSPHSTRTLLPSVSAGCEIQQHEVLVGLRCLPKSCILPCTCQLPETPILTNG